MKPEGLLLALMLMVIGDGGLLEVFLGMPNYFDFVDIVVDNLFVVQ